MARPPSAFRQRDVTRAVKAALSEGMKVGCVRINSRSSQIDIVPAVNSPADQLSALPKKEAMETVVKRRMSREPPKDVTVDISLSKTGGGIYFAGFGDYVKIGRSGHVEARIRELQTGSPEKIELYFVLREDRIQEQDFHRKFAEQRMNGEWFRRDGALANFIEDVRRRLRHD